MPLVFRRVKTNKPYVAVTVDDFITADYHKETAIKIMQAANELHATLTLCPAGVALVGYSKNQPAQAAQIKQLFYTGSYELCDHTYTHPYMDKLALNAQVSEMERGQLAIRGFFGRNPSPIYRPPFGKLNPATVQAAGTAGFSHIVLWSQDTRDSVGPEKPAQQLLANVSKAAPGDIILTHANRLSSAQAMPLIIQMLRKKGLQLVSLSVLIASGQPSN